MLYGFSELVKYLSLPFEQPGTDQPESAVGADHDQDGPTLCSGSTLANRFATGTGTGAAAADAVVADDAAVADGAGRSVFDLSVSGPPPAPSEGRAPPNKKQKH